MLCPASFLIPLVTCLTVLAYLDLFFPILVYGLSGYAIDHFSINFWFRPLVLQFLTGSLIITADLQTQCSICCLVNAESLCDVVPQKSFGACAQQWMWQWTPDRPKGYCAKTCGYCKWKIIWVSASLGHNVTGHLYCMGHDQRNFTCWIICILTNVGWSGNSFDDLRVKHNVARSIGCRLGKKNCFQHPHSFAICRHILVHSVDGMYSQVG